MTLLALAFFITVNTSPIIPGPDQYGQSASVILYDAPSKEDAEHWANDFAQRRLLENHPDQKLTSLKVIPIRDRLLTSNGDELIDWDAFAEHVRATESYDDHPNEFGIGMLLKPQVKSSPTSEPVAFDVDAIKKQIPNAELYNWDEKKQFHYILYQNSEAFIVRAMNMLLSCQPYSLATKENTDVTQPVEISPWTGAEKYHK